MDNTLVQKVSMTMRVDVGDLARWKVAANRAGLSVSEWIRQRCGENRVAVPKETAKRGAKKFSKPDLSVPTTSDAQTCRHGRRADQVCWDCGGEPKVRKA